MKDNWKNLESSAHSWQADAFLTNVTINVAGQRHYPIEVEYHSQNSPNQILVIGVDKTGKIIPIPFSANTAQDLLLEQEWKFDENDWLIDSQEALNILARSEEIRSCLTKPSRAQIQLILNRVFTKSVAWQVWISDCQGKDLIRSNYLDAKTGETVLQQ